MKITSWKPKTSLFSVKGNPFSQFFGNWLDDSFWNTDLLATEFTPKVDVVEKDNAIVVKADIPGIDEKNLKVELNGNRLTLSGKKEEEKESKDGEFHRVERSFGSFYRSIALPDGIETQKISAEYKKGVLTVSVPKTKDAQVKKLQIKVS